MSGATPTKAAPPLTVRETEVLILASKGFSATEVGIYLGVAGTTVNDYKKAIFKKLEVTTTVEAAVWACKAGLV